VVNSRLPEFVEAFRCGLDRGANARSSIS
jgi:hypothetical protein